MGFLISMSMPAIPVPTFLVDVKRQVQPATTHVPRYLFLWGLDPRNALRFDSRDSVVRFFWCTQIDVAATVVQFGRS